MTIAVLFFPNRLILAEFFKPRGANIQLENGNSDPYRMPVREQRGGGIMFLQDFGDKFSFMDGGDRATKSLCFSLGAPPPR